MTAAIAALASASEPSGALSAALGLMAAGGVMGAAGGGGSGRGAGAEGWGTAGGCWGANLRVADSKASSEGTRWCKVAFLTDSRRSTPPCTCMGQITIHEPMRNNVHIALHLFQRHPPMPLQID